MNLTSYMKHNNRWKPQFH